MNFKKNGLLFSPKKRYRLLRIIIGAAAIALPFILIFRKVNIEALPSAITMVAWWTVPVLLTASFIAMTLQGVRWWVLIRAFTDKLTLVQSLSLHFTSMFYSLFLPNSTVQEVIRSVVAIKHVGSVTSWASAWINKITGILVSFGFSVAGIIILPHAIIPKPALITIVVLFFLIIGLVVASFSKTFTKPFAAFGKRVIPQKALSFLNDLRNGIYAFRTRRLHLLGATLLTALVQLVLVMGITFLIRGITGRMFFLECLAFIPLIEMISMAQPFTPNGIGVRDGLIALMFSYLGLSPEQLGIYIIISNLSIFLKLTGAIPVVFDMVKKRRMREKTPIH
jgi:glycosyltransferase 2 family protein